MFQSSSITRESYEIALLIDNKKTIHNSRNSSETLGIKLHAITNITNSPYFSLQLDESTDITHTSQLLVYVRYIRDNKVEEEFLLCNL